MIVIEFLNKTLVTVVFWLSRVLFVWSVTVTSILIPFAVGKADVNVTTTGKLLSREILAFDTSNVKVIGGSGVGAAGDDEEGLQLIFKQKSKINNLSISFITAILIQLICVFDRIFFQ